MFFPHSTKSDDQGFTLIELLTVISIIAVLAGLLLPVVSSVMNNARKTQAAADEKQICLAVAAYQTEYGKLPLNSDNTGYVTCYGDPSGYARYPSFELFDILRAIPESGGYNDKNQLNPRAVVYFQAPNVKSATAPREGFLLKDTNDGNYTIKAGSLVDPWGSEYIIYLDGNGSGDLNQAIRWFYTNTPVGQGPSGPVQVSSLGPDGNFGKNQVVQGSDDVVTW